jgi:hypothetical protein
MYTKHIRSGEGVMHGVLYWLRVVCSNLQSISMQLAIKSINNRSNNNDVQQRQQQKAKSSARPAHA